MIPPALLEKFPAERVLKFLRSLICRGGRATCGLSTFVLSLEMHGLVRIPGARSNGGAVVQTSDAGRAAASADGWTRPVPKARPWRDTPQEARMCPRCCGPYHGGTPCPAAGREIEAAS